MTGCQIFKAKAKEGHVGSESNVAERADTIQMLKHTLPICFDGTGAWSILAVQVRVQDFYDLLVHRRLKLASEERRSGQLLHIRRYIIRDNEANWERLGSAMHTYLDANKVLWFEIVGRAPAPVNNVLVLALTPQFTVPVGDAQVVVYESVAHVTVPEHRVEEGLERDHKRIVSAQYFKTQWCEKEVIANVRGIKCLSSIA